MKFLDSLSLLTLVLQEAGTASLPETEGKREAQPHGKGDSSIALHLGNYALSLDNYDKVTDLSSYEELTDYGDHLPQDQLYSEHYGSKDIVKRYNDQAATMTRPLHWACWVPQPATITAYLYTCLNQIHQIQARDFKGLTILKRVDLSRNFIFSINDNALYLLPALLDLILPDNQLAALPRLPTGIEVLDICLNWLQSWGIKPRVFRALEKLHFLYLVGNLLDSIPGPLPLSLCSLHLQNNTIETMQSDTFCDKEEHKQTQRRLEDYCLDGNPSTWASSPVPTSACHSSLQAPSPSSPLPISRGLAPGGSPKAYPPKDFLPGVN